MTFYEWLLSKTHREDHLGKFSRLMTGEKAERHDVPKDGDLKDWERWLYSELEDAPYKARRKMWRKFKMEWNRYQDETTGSGMARRYDSG